MPGSRGTASRKKLPEPEASNGGRLYWILGIGAAVVVLGIALFFVIKGMQGETPPPPDTNALRQERDKILQHRQREQGTQRAE